MNKIRFALFAIVLVSSLISVAQKSSYYVVSDSVFYASVDLISGSKKQNAQFVRVIENGVLVKFSPFEITEYGTKEGDIYLAKDLVNKRVFLQQLHKGWFSLYAYHGQKTIFYLENNNKELIELDQDKDRLRQVLNEQMTSCLKVQPAIEAIRYNQNELTKLTEAFNYCKSYSIPRLAFGTAFALNSIKSEIQFRYIKINANSGFRPMIGIWLESPLVASRVSLRVEFAYLSFENSKTQLKNGLEVDYIGDAKLLNVPFTMKINGKNNNEGLFYQFGLLSTYNLNSHLKVFETTISDNIVKTNGVDIGHFPKNLIGPVLGIGYSFYQGVLPGLAAELRYSIQNGNAGATKTKISGINILITYKL